MKDIKNPVKFTMTPNTDTIKSKYIVEVECDSNDADYIKARYVLPEKAMTETDILLIAYLNMRDMPYKWEPNIHTDNPYNVPFGGEYVVENERFGEIKSRYGSQYWLEKYVQDRCMLLFCGAIDDYCHSISGITVTYYDNQGKKFDCEDIDIVDIFDTEEEFIEYVKNLGELKSEGGKDWDGWDKYED